MFIILIIIHDSNETHINTDNKYVLISDTKYLFYDKILSWLFSPKTLINTSTPLCPSSQRLRTHRIECPLCFPLIWHWIWLYWKMVSVKRSCCSFGFWIQSKTWILSLNVENMEICVPIKQHCNCAMSPCDISAAHSH